jgi:hypothetical protein
MPKSDFGLHLGLPRGGRTGGAELEKCMEVMAKLLVVALENVA